MKENFNTQEYRDNLAKDLKDIRKDDPDKAQELLADAKETDEYKYSKYEHSRERNYNLRVKKEKELGKFDKNYLVDSGLYGLMAGYRTFQHGVLRGNKEFQDSFRNALKSGYWAEHELPTIEKLYDNVSDEKKETVAKINDCIKRLNQVIKNPDSETLEGDFAETYNKLNEQLIWYNSAEPFQNRANLENSKLELKKEEYFRNIEKETLEKIINIIQHAIRMEGIIVHTDSSIKGKVIKKFEEDKENVDTTGGTLEDDSYFSTNSGWLEELMEKGQIARITNMQIAPGPDTEGYFATQYYLKKDGTCTVDVETTENVLKEELFQKFTGHTESFEVKLGEVIKMLDNDKKIAQELITEVEKTDAEYGEMGYRDFINRINLD